MPSFPMNKCFSFDFFVCFHSFYDYIHTVPPQIQFVYLIIAYPQ